MKKLIVLFLLLTGSLSQGQNNVAWIEELEIDKIPAQTKTRFWLKMIESGMSQPVSVPVIVIRGREQAPILGLTAAIHGNELNGIKVIQEVLEEIDPTSLNGTIVAVPGLNAISLVQHERRYFDQEDLNRQFPGKENGNRSQRYVWQINQKVLSKLDYLVDMHTASFGRENTLYVRARLDDSEMEKMAKLQDADIILNSDGLPSANQQSSSTRTLRAEAMLKGIPTLTLEYGNPQVYQPELIERGKRGIMNLMSGLNMIENEVEAVPEATICRKSYWIYAREGGYLELKVELNQKLQQGEVIAVVRNPFGDVLQTYYCPEKGIVIGRSSNPVNMSGGRIIHLGIIDE